MKKHQQNPSLEQEPNSSLVISPDMNLTKTAQNETEISISSHDLPAKEEADSMSPTSSVVDPCQAGGDDMEETSSLSDLQSVIPVEGIIPNVDLTGKVTGINTKVRPLSRFRRGFTRHKIVHGVATSILFTIALTFAVFALLPIVLTVLNSFMSTKEIVTNYSAVFSSLSSNMSEQKTYLATEAHLKLIPDMVSIEQYATVLFKSPMYIQKFWNSIFLVVPIVIFQMITGSLAAYSFARYRRKRREVLYFLYIILMLMPFQVTLVPNYLIADKLGILNSMQAIILPGIFSTFSVFLLTKYMRRIPSSYIEAAKLDGAGDWHIFTRICIPMCKSALYAMAILLFIDYWNMVEQPLILLPDPEKQPLSVFLAEINSGEVGIAFAASFIFMVPPLLIFLNGEQYLVEGISKSGLK